jgi:pimeloyl-ACP methyl ester carboxylesterase
MRKQRSNKRFFLTEQKRTAVASTPAWRRILSCRPFLIQGVEDFTALTSLARTFMEIICAPAKTLITMERAAHFAVFMKSGAFLDQLVSRVLPLVGYADGTRVI